MNDASINIQGINIAYQHWNDPSLPPLLALHGWLDNSASFLPLIPYLKQHHIIAIDFPGHGWSDHFNNDLPYHFVDAAIHLAAFVDAMGWQRFSLLGHSMGGGMACLLAGMLGDKIDKLAIIEGLGPLTETEESAPLQVNDYIKRAKKIIGRKPNVYASLERCAEARAMKGHIGIEHARILSERGTKPQGDGWVWRHDPKLYLPSPVRLTEGQVIAFLQAITAPVCLLVGDDGFRYDEDKIQGREAAVKQFERHVIHGGHHCHMEQPEAVSQVLNDFFNR